MMFSGVEIPQRLDIESKIEITAINNQVDPEKMLALCDCESKFYPKAFNKKDPQGGAKGLFQFLTPTFLETAKKYGLKDPDIWNIDHQIKLTAFLLAQNKWKLWYNCSKKIGMI